MGIQTGQQQGIDITGNGKDAALLNVKFRP
jgi:hypothetical protein